MYLSTADAPGKRQRARPMGPFGHTAASLPHSGLRHRVQLEMAVFVIPHGRRTLSGPQAAVRSARSCTVFCAWLCTQYAQRLSPRPAPIAQARASHCCISAAVRRPGGPQGPGPDPRAHAAAAMTECGVRQSGPCAQKKLGQPWQGYVFAEVYATRRARTARVLSRLRGAVAGYCPRRMLLCCLSSAYVLCASNVRDKTAPLARWDLRCARCAYVGYE
ncbi:hypothetical protein HYPSUDRAFT_420120 [Hypholoma sublateritium FD-334 SS-4]|uniref:Uncharacterized protein n=1 Tax=Hypholoma sublateritium (strain FD-334 SS-4) TaxID=945553 RepID=A0A0D2P9K5_HYPSF|nr:hypothetical protein HYPSUDRAFT_420120 [Hypholoma sublateritium FD-334 SS-4]